jgi:hypothetical protein
VDVDTATGEVLDARQDAELRQVEDKQVVEDFWQDEGAAA